MKLSEPTVSLIAHAIYQADFDPSDLSIRLPASTSAPTAVVHFVVTALSLPAELPPLNENPIDFEEELESGLLGCYVDPKVTKLMQSGVEKSRVPNDGGWLGLRKFLLPILLNVSAAN
jgi:peroxin-6